MRAATALVGVAAVAVAGVLAVGLLAAATATADPCPPAAGSVPVAAQALRFGPGALMAPTAGPATAVGAAGTTPPVVQAGEVCQPATAAVRGPVPGAGGADAAFDPGNIASDEVFYNTSSMTLQDISAFIDEQNTGCGGPWCLSNLRLDTTSQPADAYCQAYTGGTAQSAAEMLYDFSRACGINPQVLLVTLQKESQGLTRTGATEESSWAAAWGWSCPDTGPGGSADCDPAHAGFFHQGYGMAHQWAKYRVEIPNGTYNYQPGKTYDILWNVAETGCGAGPVSIRNLATASLYVYTPYQPNAASLAAYPGKGDACSSYGNRNFFRLFQEYFGSTGGGTNTGPPAGGSGPNAGEVGAVPVVTSGSTVTIPAGPYTIWRGRDYAGTVITTPTPGIAAGIAAGLAYLGLQYAWGGGNAGGPTLGIRGGKNGDAHGDYARVGFDCSGLTSYVAARYPAALPRTSGDQRSNAPQQVPWDQAMPGDLVGYAGHIAVYLGVIDGQRMQLESPQSGDHVRVSGVRSDADSVVHRWWTA